ncbi:MAG: hypothetical protein RBT72_00825 [Spirochaetia bacterium]|jgi:hypothetical protein|nr:hypothetical protein [Spirochaetales bacterium]MDX9783283.1 hypothetical protein [Spirochaetia bacterium]
MNKKVTARRNSLDWAGSSPVEGAVTGPPGASARQDVYKVITMRHKLDDDSYVDGAVTRIASFLTNRLDKKEKDGK